MLAILDKILDKLPLLPQRTRREVACDLDLLLVKGWRAVVGRIRWAASSKLPQRPRRGYRMTWANRLFLLIWCIESAYFFLLALCAAGLLIPTPSTSLRQFFALLALSTALFFVAGYYRRLAYEERYGR